MIYYDLDSPPSSDSERDEDLPPSYAPSGAKAAKEKGNESSDEESDGEPPTYNPSKKNKQDAEAQTPYWLTEEEVKKERERAQLAEAKLDILQKQFESYRKENADRFALLQTKFDELSNQLYERDKQLLERVR